MWGLSVREKHRATIIQIIQLRDLQIEVLHVVWELVKSQPFCPDVPVPIIERFSYYLRFDLEGRHQECIQFNFFFWFAFAHKQGLADPLNSAFHLTYNMVLNLLRVEEVNPEIMLEKSFHQFQNYASVPGMIDSKQCLVQYILLCMDSTSWKYSSVAFI